MLLEFSVENYLSIKDKLTLNLECTSQTSNLRENCFKEDKYDLLKSVVIYGANATGKSNIIKALSFFSAMILNSQNHKFGDKMNVVPYKLDSKMEKKPTKFEIIFLLDGKKYVYEFSLDREKIVTESLRGFLSNGRPKEFFKRTAKNFIFTDDKPRQERIREDTNENQLYLSKIALHNYERLKPIYEFLTQKIIVGTNNQWGVYTKNKLNEDLEFRKWVLSILKKADFGGIIDVKTEIKERELKGFEFQIGTTSPSIRKMDGEKQKYLDIDFVHKNEKGKKILFKEVEESEGTIRTFNMLGPIYDILEKGMIVFIDEFEINLHPEITRFLVKLFHSKHNKKNGQIVFTTHDTSLLKANDVFRRDQIYLTEKNPNSNTTLHSFMEYNLREGIDFQNAYLGGRVGGMPFVDESFI